MNSFNQLGQFKANQAIAEQESNDNKENIDLESIDKNSQ